MRGLIGFGLVVALGIPAQAAAFSMGEVSAAQGIQSTLAGTGSSPALSALSTVKRNVSGMTPAAIPAELTGLGEVTNTPRTGRKPSQPSASGGNGGGRWQTAAGGKGWASQSGGSGKGWVVADNKGAGNAKPWASGGSAGKSWQTAGTSGGARH